MGRNNDDSNNHFLLPTLIVVADIHYKLVNLVNPMASSSSGSSVDYCSIYFAFPNLTPINGEPNSDILIKLKNQLKANASSVPSNLGGGAHGHLGLVLSPATYAMVANTPFVQPAHPGPLAIPPGTTGPMATVLCEKHVENL